MPSVGGSGRGGGPTVVGVTGARGTANRPVFASQHRQRERHEDPDIGHDIVDDRRGGIEPAVARDAEADRDRIEVRAAADVRPGVHARERGGVVGAQHRADRGSPGGAYDAQCGAGGTESERGQHRAAGTAQRGEVHLQQHQEHRARDHRGEDRIVDGTARGRRRDDAQVGQNRASDDDDDCRAELAQMSDPPEHVRQRDDDEQDREDAERAM